MNLILRPSFFLRTKLHRALSIDSENWHAKTVDQSEQN